MAEAHRTYFRPTVVICVGEVGREIRDQLTPDGGRLQTNSRSPARHGARLLASLDPPLRQGVSLIQFPSEHYGDTAQSPDDIPAQSWLVDHMFQQIERTNHALSYDGLPDEGVPDDFRFQPFEEGVPLQRLFQNALVHVQAQENLLNVADAGFMIVNPNTQIFIVGDVESEWVGYVLQVVHLQLERFRLQTEVSFILSRYEPASGGRVGFDDVGWTKRLDWGNRSLANFNFLYENAMRESNRTKATFLTREQSYYTAAEALFSLIATGATTLDQYQQPMRLMPNQEIYQQVGNLSTSLVIFPYRAVRRFCSEQLGAELMDEWLDDINRSSVSEGERARQQERARRDVSEIENWIKDNEVRPGTEYLGEQNSSRRSRNDPARTRSRILRWPSLSILRNPAQRQRTERPFLEHERMEERERREQREHEEEASRQEHLTRYRRLRDQTRDLFEFFSYKEVKKESREHPDGPEAWAEIALGRSSRASDMIVNWSTEANQTWAAVSQRASNNIQRTVDRIWPTTNNGLDLARIYTDEYDDKLTELANLLSVWRKTHRADYLSTLSEFDRLADGPWVRNEDDPAINNSINPANAGQARPMGANGGVSGPIVKPMPGGFLAPAPAAVIAPPQPIVPPAPPPIPGQRQQIVGLHQHLPEREREIARRLGQRLTWEYSRVPRWPNLAAAGILVTPVIILTLLALVPTFAATPLNIMVVIAGTIIVVALGSWLFRRYQERNLIKIQKELLKFYSYYYANRCETREDFLRVNVMAPLRMRVSRMRERLDDMRGFILLVSNRMEEAAREAHDRLFDPRLNPAAARDVYVGNGALLQKSGWERDIPHITPVMIRQRRLERRSRQRNRNNNERERQMRYEKRATNTLEDCAEKIHAKRLSERRKEPWHHPADLRPALLLSFQNNPRSILEMSVDEAVRYIDAFTGPVINAYLTDNDPDLVSIGLALDWKETWDAVFDRMERPAYLLLGGNTSTELVFICGRQQDIDSGQRFIEKRQGNYIRVDTKNPDWLLIAGFFRDSAPAALNIDLLFPLRK